MTIIRCEISLGELVDKISILRIKMENIKEPEKLLHIKKEENVLSQTLNDLNLSNIDFHLKQMIEINQKLWKVEDDIRDCERQKDFGERFVELARSVYFMNDERFKRKNAINKDYQSGLVEVKSYKEY